MALSDRLCGILATGAEKERAAHDFYAEAAGRTANDLGKKMFERLADDESKHEQLLKSWAAEGTCPTAPDEGGLGADLLVRGRQQVAEAVSAETGDLEAIELGRKMEREAIAFYQEGADAADDQASKDLLLRLKAEEEKHLALLTDFYEYMRDPQTWSLREGGAHFDS